MKKSHYIREKNCQCVIMIAFPFFHTIQTHFVIWLFQIFFSHSQYAHTRFKAHTHKTPKLPPQSFDIFFIFNLAHSIAKNGKKIYLNHADDLKNREKVKVIFFLLNKIEAWSFFLLLYSPHL